MYIYAHKKEQYEQAVEERAFRRMACKIAFSPLGRQSVWYIKECRRCKLDRNTWTRDHPTMKYVPLFGEENEAQPFRCPPGEVC